MWVCIWNNGDQKTHSDMRTFPPKLASGTEFRKGWETLKTGNTHTHTQMDKLKLRTCFRCTWARGLGLIDSAQSALFYFLQNPVNTRQRQFVIFFCSHFLLSSTFLSNFSLPFFLLSPSIFLCFPSAQDFQFRIMNVRFFFVNLEYRGTKFLVLLRLLFV